MNFNGYDYCTAKQLFINDSDKRKHFELHVKCFFQTQTDIGTFTSRRIKVISKPSKKKQSIKNNDLSIQSGTKIALYNRLRSQTVSTRYLNVEGSDFKASSTEWGSFTIYLIDNPHNDADDNEDEFSARVGGEFIKYGDVVKLVHNDTKIALPRMVMRRVEKNLALRNANDPVSQMHKCCFQFKVPSNSPYQQQSFYMGLNQEAITQVQASPKDVDHDQITEGACWTIVSVENVAYNFNDDFAPQRVPVNPVPVVENMTISGNIEQNTCMVQFEGENFSANLQVWFDHVPAETIYWRWL